MAQDAEPFPSLTAGRKQFTHPVASNLFTLFRLLARTKFVKIYLNRVCDFHFYFSNLGSWCDLSRKICISLFFMIFFQLPDSLLHSLLEFSLVLLLQNKSYDTYLYIFLFI